MTDESDKVFWNQVDAFIEQANQACEAQEPSAVSAALLQAAARFNAFVVAASSIDRKEYIVEMEPSLNYLTDNYRQLLRDNLEDYREHYKIYIQAARDAETDD
ncbi:DUF3144 domain-containing protein [Marinimicrobium alkaliphilum]|uniref:DUF3144 domain-containing protein n=1 Tax=Marinimicrobium alkaliphilum TaxID=2202654 RepID=UPI000DB93D9C|nr:DUF3144 domain-containing protein [Marinimicrobium alkaliphilum]